MYVTNIQRFSLDDGPGIRTTIFLSGCNLRCLWCHNPENMKKVKLREEPCKSEKVDEIYNVKEISVDGILNEVKKDKKFYDRSSGGITISGGEPMLQVEKIQTLLRECKKQGISTAIETALNYDYELIEKVAPYTDLFIVDCKAVSDDVHRNCTGVHNRKILYNIKKMSDEKKRMWIRIPIVPNVNITLEEMKRIADFLADVYVERIELVPYHKFGVYKYEELRMVYQLYHVSPPTKEFMNKCFEILSSKCTNVLGMEEK